MLDFTVSEAQKAMQRAARNFASQVLTGAHAVYSVKADQKERFRAIRPFYRIAVAGGMVKGQVPTPLGGSCDSLVDAAIMLEEMYATDPSVVLTIAATGLGLTPLVMSGHSKHQKKYLEPFLKDEGEPLASLVHSEPGGTANWLEKGAPGLQTTARKEGDNWIINGEKLWTTNSGGWDGRGADLQCIVCRQITGTSVVNGNANGTTNGEIHNIPNGTLGIHEGDPASAIIILLVTRDIIASNEAGAYTILAEPDLMGHPATTGPHSRFTNFKIPDENVLAIGEEAAGLVEQSFTASAALVGAFSVSIMRAAFDAALAFAKNDTRNGTVPILERQSVANLLQDIKIRTDTSRLLTWKALHSLENGPGDFRVRQELCLEAKIFGSDNSVEAVTKAMNVVGMSSYAHKMPFARLLNDAMCLPLFDGGNIGIRRRQLEKLYLQKDYTPWASFE